MCHLITIRRFTSSNNIYENNNTKNIIIKDEELDINKNVTSTNKVYFWKLYKIITNISW